MRINLKTTGEFSLQNFQAQNSETSIDEKR